MKCVSLIVFGSLLLLVASAKEGTIYPGWTAARVADNVTLSWSLSQSLKTSAFFFVKLNTSTSSKVIFSLKKNTTYLDVQLHGNNRTQYTGNTSITKDVIFSFIVKNVRKEDAGKYFCKEAIYLVTNCGHGLVVLQRPSTPNISLSKYKAVQGLPVTVNCSSTSKSIPPDHPLTLSYIWKRNGRYIQNNSGSELTIYNVTRHDTGAYMCQAVEGTEDKEIRSKWSQQVDLDVLYGPDQVKFDPDSDTVTVSEDRNINVTCSADCNPPCTVTWMDNSGQTLSQSLQKAVIKLTERESEKSPFNCVVRNNFGGNSRNVSIHIPSSIRNCTSNTVTEDGTINIVCIVYGKPQPDVTFKLRGKSVFMKLNNTWPVNTYKYSYVIKHARCLDHGKYDVTASNNVGSTNNYQLYMKVKCSGSEPSNAIIPVAAVCSMLVLVLAVVAAVFIQRYKSKKGSERYRVREDVEENPKSCGPSGDDVYATIRKTNRKKNKDLCTKVRKPRHTPQACTNKLYASAGPKSESQALINPDSAGELDGTLNNNCGEKNADGLTYADLDLPAPTMVNGQPVINSKEEPVVYEEIDFSQTPGPQLPEKIWEKEGSAP